MNHSVIPPYFQFDLGTKEKEIQFDVEIFKQIYTALMAGFERGIDGKLWLHKVISKTDHVPLHIFKGIATYQNNHGGNTIDALDRQKLCTASIAADKKI